MLQLVVPHSLPRVYAKIMERECSRLGQTRLACFVKSQYCASPTLQLA